MRHKNPIVLYCIFIFYCRNFDTLMPFLDAVISIFMWYGNLSGVAIVLPSSLNKVAHRSGGKTGYCNLFVVRGTHLHT